MIQEEKPFKKYIYKTKRGFTMRMKYIFLSLSVLLFTAILGGCNTVDGFGQDVEKAGEEVQRAAD